MMPEVNRFLPNADLMADLDGLYAGRDSDSGIRSSELLLLRIAELSMFIAPLERSEPHRLAAIDVLEAIARHLYGTEPYSAEDRWRFMQWLAEEIGVDLP